MKTHLTTMLAPDFDVVNHIFANAAVWTKTRPKQPTTDWRISVSEGVGPVRVAELRNKSNIADYCTDVLAQAWDDAREVMFSLRFELPPSFITRRTRRPC